MKIKISFFILFFTCNLFNAFSAKAQTTGANNKDTVLYKTILHMDSVVFDAFNTHNLDVLKNVFAPDLEFYHDHGGLNGYDNTINSFKSVFAQTPGLRRELVKGTMEVYPIPGYGAVEFGIHKFIHIENGKEITGVYKFVHTWQFKNGEWKITRVVSVGH